MQQNNREGIFSALMNVSFNCEQHPEEIANMIIYNQQSQVRTIICTNCLVASQIPGKQLKPLKIALLQIHRSWKKLLTDVSISAFVDHHLNLIRGIVKNHFKQIQVLLQNSVTNWFQKYRELITGKYFNEFYSTAFQIIESHNKSHNQQGNTAIKLKRTKKLVSFIDSFFNLVTSFEDYEKMNLEEMISGESLVRQIKSQVGQMYKQFKEKAQTAKNWQQEQILQLFNPSLQSSHVYRFSSTLLHSSLKLLDPKTIKMPNLPDNEYTLIALIEPCIGNKKRSIKLKMVGIKGWVAAGIAIRSRVQANAYKFQQANHGTCQISYDGYSWSQDSSVNEQYTSWYFNQNDTLTITVVPNSGQLEFVRNEELNHAYTLTFKSQKKDKIYFCVSLNYNEDSVAIFQ